MCELNICHLYPDLLNLYGDRGNIITLIKRCQWRGITANLFPISIGDAFNPENYDLIFLGGGQDYEQEIIQSDLLTNKATEIKNAINNNKVILAICGGYQLLGKYFKTSDGKEIEFLGALDFWTLGSKQRMIGNTVYTCEFLKNEDFDGSIVGFENHSGKTYLGKDVEPLFKVIKGFGNNGEDGFEGARFKNVFCTYSHGSFLPKNPVMADYLISNALKQKYSDFDELSKLDDAIENEAHVYVKNMIIKK